MGTLAAVCVAGTDAGQPVPIMLGQVFIQGRGFFGISVLGPGQMGNSRFDDDTTGIVLPAIWAACVRQFKGANQVRKSDALQYQRDENRAEREEDDQVAMREGSAVSEHDRQRKRG